MGAMHDGVSGFEDGLSFADIAKGGDFLRLRRGRARRVAPTALGEFLGLVSQPLRAGLDCAALRAGLVEGVGLWWRFALENAGGAGGCGKAAAEPPHSIVGWAVLRLTTLREDFLGGRGGSRLVGSG
jgi:hypothetical protein